MKILFISKSRKKKAKNDNYGIVIWQILLIVVFSGLISYLILFTQQNNLPTVDCKGKKKNNQGWVKCSNENINHEKK